MSDFLWRIRIFLKKDLYCVKEVSISSPVKRMTAQKLANEFLRTGTGRLLTLFAKLSPDVVWQNNFVERSEMKTSCAVARNCRKSL